MDLHRFVPKLNFLGYCAEAGVICDGEENAHDYVRKCVLCVLLALPFDARAPPLLIRMFKRRREREKIQLYLLFYRFRGDGEDVDMSARYVLLAAIRVNKSDEVLYGDVPFVTNIMFKVFCVQK